MPASAAPQRHLANRHALRVSGSDSDALLFLFSKSLWVYRSRGEKWATFIRWRSVSRRSYQTHASQWTTTSDGGSGGWWLTMWGRPTWACIGARLTPRTTRQTSTASTCKSKVRSSTRHVLRLSFFFWELSGWWLQGRRLGGRGGAAGYCFRSISLFVCMCVCTLYVCFFLSFFLCFFVSKITRKRLDRFAWNFQGRYEVTMGRPDYIFGQFRETARCRDAQHGDGVCCAFALQLVLIWVSPRLDVSVPVGSETGLFIACWMFFVLKLFASDLLNWSNVKCDIRKH